jgi:isocitrate dehydrogenase
MSKKHIEEAVRHSLEVYFKDLFEKYKTLFSELGVDTRNGLGDVYSKIAGNPLENEVKAAIDEIIETSEIQIK